MTGLADSHTDLVPKRLELLKQLVPSASRVGVLWNPSNASTAPQLKAVQTAGSTLGLSIVPVDVKAPGRDTLDQAFAAIERDRLGGLLILSEPTLGNLRGRIAELTIAHRLPASGTHRGWAEAGVLMSYGTDFVALFRHGAGVVDKILKGARPDSLPVERPTKFNFMTAMRSIASEGKSVNSSKGKRTFSKRVLEPNRAPC